MSSQLSSVRKSDKLSLGGPGSHRSVHKPDWQKQVWQRFVVFLLVRASTYIQSLSRSAAVRAGNGLGRLAYHVAKRQRRRALANLSLAFGETMTLHQRDTLTRQVFQHFGRALIDFLRAPRNDAAHLSQRVSCDGWEHVAAALKRGKGVVLVTGHLGNWELMGRWLATVQKVPLTVVAKEPENPALAVYLRSMRENAGFTVLSKGESARGLLRALRRGEAILILADQNSADVFVPFFGVPTGTAAGPASLALHSGAALIPISCLETPDHSFQVTCLSPLAVTTATDVGSAEAILQATAELSHILEDTVRQHPEQWLWLHNRWKSAFEEKHRSVWATTDAFCAAQKRWHT